jgi:two-component system chemotaxis response regulator CheB
MARARVLLVDDAIVVRRLLTEIIAEDPEFEVCGSAQNGKIALQKLPQLAPDIVVLDVEMPEMDGIETLMAIRKSHPRLPVIMFSTLTERGASTTIEALTLGASDYVTKPTNAGSVLLARQQVRDQLLPKLRHLTARVRGTTASTVSSTKAAAAPAVPAPRPASSTRIALPQGQPRKGPAASPEVVAIGVSTGGPNALAVVIPALPADFPVPVLIVQHMPPLFTRFLADRLAAKSRVKVVEATDGMPVRAGCVYIAPGDYHMVTERKGTEVVLRLNQEPPENSCRPAVDPLFRSVTQVWGSHVLGVVLTGMGQDGCRGAGAIREAGGTVFAQDEATSTVWGMPGYVVQQHLADKVLPLEQVAAEIVRHAPHGARVG